MKPEELQPYLNEMMRVGEETAPLAKAMFRAELFVAEHWIVFTIALLAWYALHLHATWTNLRDNRGIDRFTWLFVIWAVPLGLIFYWVQGDRREGGHAFDVTPPPAPPPPTENDTAAAVLASLAEDAKTRRANRRG